MFHALVLALCLIGVLAVVAGAIRALIGSKLYPRSDSLSGHTAQHTLEHYFGAKRYATDIMFGTAASPRASQEGWVLIDRSLRAKRAVRLAAR